MIYNPTTDSTVQAKQCTFSFQWTIWLILDDEPQRKKMLMKTGRTETTKHLENLKIHDTLHMEQNCFECSGIDLLAKKHTHASILIFPSFFICYYFVFITIVIIIFIIIITY